MPKWLRESEISIANIEAWWADRTQLNAGGHDFDAFLASAKQPSATIWKTKAREFLEAYSADIPVEDVWLDIPKGSANVLKGALPFYILVPAVRDVTEEAKGARTSPFGRLLSAVLDAITQEKREHIQGLLDGVTHQMNRSGGPDRLQGIADTENRLNALLRDLFAECDLQIEFETPTIETLLTSPRLYVDDGFRNVIENKGHGLQRAVIFSILRQYAEQMTLFSTGSRRSLFLGIEEPELYMHPQAQRTIKGVLRRIAAGGDQVMFSTHSPLLVDVAYFDEIVRMEAKLETLDGKKVTESRAWQLPMHRMIDDFKARYPHLKDTVTEQSMRERYSHVYNPMRNEGFFASRIILVEGHTEEYTLPVYASAIPGCSFDQHGISVVECGGKSSMDRLYRVFNELGVPCFILFDYDSCNSDSETRKSSKEILALAGLSDEPPQTILITSDVACFPRTWEKDLKEEMPDFEPLTKQARQELGVSGDSKPLIARYIAHKYIQQEPPYVPPSVRSIIEKALAVVWRRSCLAGAVETAVAGGDRA